MQILVVITIIGIAVGLVLPVTVKVRASARATHCLSNLRNVSAAFRMYAGENRGALPDPAHTQVPWERSLAAYVGDETFVCPGDQELAPATGSSYDWRDTGLATTTLAGLNLVHVRPDAVLAFDALPGWHGKSQMNAVRADGSVLPLDAGACVRDLQLPALVP